MILSGCIRLRMRNVLVRRRHERFSCSMAIARNRGKSVRQICQANLSGKSLMGNWAMAVRLRRVRVAAWQVGVAEPIASVREIIWYRARLVGVAMERQNAIGSLEG